MAISNERSNGMVGYVLTGPVRSPLFFISKFIVLLGMCLMAIGIAIIMYLLMFSLLGMAMMAPAEYLKVVEYIFLTMAVFSALGLLTSTLADKKGMTVAMAIVIYFILSLLMPMAIGLGVNMAHDAHPNVANDQILEYIPLPMKILIYGNPMIISYAEQEQYQLGGQVLLDGTQAILISLGFIAAFLAIGMLIFSRERPRNNDLKHAKG